MKRSILVASVLLLGLSGVMAEPDQVKDTQAMMKGVLGDAAQLADYDTVKNRMKSSRYTMDFQNGVIQNNGGNNIMTGAMTLESGFNTFDINSSSLTKQTETKPPTRPRTA